MKIVFDVQLCRPGCPLLQAALGGSPDTVSLMFPHETWLVAPTAAMRVYETSEEQLKQLVSRAVAAVAALNKRS